MIYLDNSASSLIKPKSVQRAVLSALTEYTANPGRSGHKQALKTALVVERTREHIARHVGTTADKIIFTLNCTDALNLAILGSFKPEGHVICTVNEHNSVLRPLEHLTKCSKDFSYSVAQQSGQTGIVWEDIEKLIQQNTYLVVCNHISNVNGDVAEIERIGKNLSEKGILFLVDGTEPAGKGDKWIVENILNKTDTPVILVMNKLDKIKNPQKIEENLMSYKTLFDKNIPLVRISAKTGRNKDTLISNILKKLPEGEKLYPDDIVTEESMRSVTEEIIREKILLNTQDEIPHSVAIKIEKYEENEYIDKIYATIFCEQKSQKGILIGKGGSLLKLIGTQARIELEEITEKKVFLALEVKVEKDWRKKDNILKKFGYKQEE